jgi:hypothetical protein
MSIYLSVNLYDLLHLDLLIGDELFKDLKFIDKLTFLLDQRGFICLNEFFNDKILVLYEWVLDSLSDNWRLSAVPLLKSFPCEEGKDDEVKVILQSFS